MKITSNLPPPKGGGATPDRNSGLDQLECITILALGLQFRVKLWQFWVQLWHARVTCIANTAAAVRRLYAFFPPVPSMDFEICLTALFLLPRFQSSNAWTRWAQGLAGSVSRATEAKEKKKKRKKKVEKKRWKVWGGKNSKTEKSFFLIPACLAWSMSPVSRNKWALTMCNATTSSSWPADITSWSAQLLTYPG